jgi:hypothetical protein
MSDLNRDAYDESVFQAQLSIVLKFDLPTPVPPEIRRELRAQEARESRARVAAEKLRWQHVKSLDSGN